MDQDLTEEETELIKEDAMTIDELWNFAQEQILEHQIIFKTRHRRIARLPKAKAKSKSGNRKSRCNKKTFEKLCSNLINLRIQ